jgi:diamine N-acetyltransferase
MVNLSLRPVTGDNFSQVVKLSETLTEYQKTCVAPNMVSLAQAYVHYDRAWPRAIYVDDEVVGFVMLALHDDDIPNDDQPAYFLWRFMMAKEHQQKGYGRRVLDMIVNKCREDHIKTLYTSAEFQGDQPLQFYLKYGFKDTGIIDDGEKVLKIEI